MHCNIINTNMIKIISVSVLNITNEDEDHTNIFYIQCHSIILKMLLWN